MRVAFDHSIGAALQACASQAPAREPQCLSAPAAANRTRNPGRDCGGALQARFTARQLEVLALLCEGLPNKLICRRLDIAMGTVKVHISCILGELGASSRLEAVVKARSLGLGGELAGRSAGGEPVPAGHPAVALHTDGHEPDRRASAAA